MFRHFTNLRLKSELMNTVDRIPEDLDVWRDEIGKKKTSLRAALEYYHHHTFYVGKVTAYLFVLEELGEHKFVEDYLKKTGMKLQHINEPQKGMWKLLDKIWRKYHLDN